MRPWDSVTGTRWTRWTPPSYFSRAQGTGKDRALLAALPRLDLQDRVTVVIGIARDQQPPQTVLGRHHGLLEAGQLISEGGILRGQLAGRLRIPLSGLPRVVCRHRRCQGRVALVGLPQPIRVTGDSRIGHGFFQGAVFLDARTGDRVDLRFANGLPGPPPHAYQGARAEFDHGPAPPGAGGPIAIRNGAIGWLIGAYDSTGQALARLQRWG